MPYAWNFLRTIFLRLSPILGYARHHRQMLNLVKRCTTVCTSKVLLYIRKSDMHRTVSSKFRWSCSSISEVRVGNWLAAHKLHKLGRGSHKAHFLIMNAINYFRKIKKCASLKGRFKGNAQRSLKQSHYTNASIERVVEEPERCVFVNGRTWWNTTCQGH